MIPTMASSLFLFFLSLIIIHLSLTTAQPPFYVSHNCSNTGNYTANSPFQANLNLTLSSLIANAAGQGGFYNTSTGQSPDPDIAYGLFQCRVDISSELCQSCIKNSSENIITLCPYQKEATIWYDECMLRYANRYIFADTGKNPSFCMCSNNDTAAVDQGQFNVTLFGLMNDLVKKAVSGSSSSMFAANSYSGNFTSSHRIYGLVQCSPDIPQSDCEICLTGSVNEIPSCCDHKERGRVVMPSCSVRYDREPFYNESLLAEQALSSPTTPSAAPPSRPPTSTNSNLSTGVPTLIAVVLLLGACIFCMWRRRRRRRRKRAAKEEKSYSQEIQLLDLRGGRLMSNDFSNENLQGENQVKSHELPLIRLEFILAATKHFSDENKLGEGGFGQVYKGTLGDGKDIAVKRLSKTSGQGLQEFKNEVTLIAKLQHRNLVRLLGWCLQGEELLLIYEYMANKSLDVFLFDSTRGAQLDWKRRLGIINGIARGILYLHEDSRLKVIHRDLKASNVLLDQEMNPKISDFGMARIFGGNQNEANTNRVVGTYGYMAPEYAMEGLFSTKSDVFSFGVLLLEIISGKRNGGFYLVEHGQSLLSFAWKLWSESRGLELMDPLLVQSYVEAEVLKCIHIGLLCVQDDPANRPTMSSVVVMLATNTMTLPKPTQPLFTVGRVVRLVESTPNKEVCSVNEITLSIVSPR